MMNKRRPFWMKRPRPSAMGEPRPFPTKRHRRSGAASWTWVFLVCGTALLPVLSARSLAAQEIPYRRAGFLFGLIYTRLDGSGGIERYLPETDSYDRAPSRGRGLYGISLGGHVWSQRTQLQIEWSMSTGEYLEEGGARDTTDGRTVDTYIDYGYTMVGVRLRQALITRRLNVSAGYGLIEEGRSRKARAERVHYNSFPADTYPVWSWGVDLRLNPAMLIGFTRTESYEHDRHDAFAPIEGWIANAFHLTVVF